MPKINDYKANMDAAIYIYIYIDVCTMIIAFIIALYLQPVLNYKVFHEGQKIVTVLITVVMDLGGLRMKNVS